MAETDRCRKYVESLCIRANAYYERWLAAKVAATALQEP